MLAKLTLAFLLPLAAIKAAPEPPRCWVPYSPLLRNINKPPDPPLPPGCILRDYLEGLEQAQMFPPVEL